MDAEVSQNPAYPESVHPFDAFLTFPLTSVLNLFR